MQQKIEELANSWYEATQKVLKLESPDASAISKLFEETYLLIKAYSNEKLIPRQIYDVLWEMNDFTWWVCSVGEDTPLSAHYEEMISLVTAYNGYVSTDRVDELDLRYNIEKLRGEV